MRRKTTYTEPKPSEPGGFPCIKCLHPGHSEEDCPYRDAPPPSLKSGNPKDLSAQTKAPLWLCSPIAKAYWATAQHVGLVKYGAWNWRVDGVRASVYLSAMERHMDKWKSGEEYCKVDNIHHLGAVMACAAILLDAQAAGKLIDDRPPYVDPSFAYDSAEKSLAHHQELYKDRRPRHFTIADTQESSPEEKYPGTNGHD